MVWYGIPHTTVCKNMKKAISLGVAAAMAATLLAGCGTAASSAATSSEAASTADSTTAESTATSEAAPSEAHEINTTDPIELTISWWGGDSRHEAACRQCPSR